MSEGNSSVNFKEIIKQEYIKCVNDPIYFMKKYCMIQHPMRGRIPFHLYPFQEKVLSLFKQYDYSIVLKSRQLGISTLVAGFSLWLMIFNKDKNILCIATKQDTAKNMVTKVKFMFENLPSWLRGKEKPLEDNKLNLKLRNGSQIKAVSAASDAGRSEAVSLLIVDEAAFIEDIESIWAAAQQTLATGGGAIALSTPNGVGNWFHNTWVKAELAENSFIPIKLPWTVHPERNQEWRAKQDQDLGPRMAAQECDTDFLTSGNTIIEPEILNFYEQTWIKDPVEKRGIGGNYWLWNYPDYNRQYLITVDVARGDGSDYSTFHVIDIEGCEQVAEFKAQIGTREFGNILISAGMEWNKALIAVENASMGWDVLQTLIQNNYPNIYHSPRGYDDSVNAYLHKLETDQMVPGFTNSLKTRPLLIPKLEAHMRDKTFIFKSKRLLEELRTLIWDNGKAKAANGYNDDLTIAVSIGLYIRDTSMKYFQHSIELTRAALNNIRKSEGIVTRANYPQTFNNPYRVDLGNGQIEDLSWILK